jgi:predicted CXXCH cytochrome family protein
MSDGTRLVVGYKPGMKLSQIEGLQLTPVDPDKIPPDAALTAAHLRNYNMWLASGHANALSRIADNERATAECYGCHSAEGFLAKLQDRTVDITQRDGFNTLTCVACHDSHNSEHPHQLVAGSQKLCTACHTQDNIVKGRGASVVEETVSYHSEIECVGCHMTEANHLMQVIRPDDPDLAENRADSCTICHRMSDKESRGTALQEWQSTFSEQMDKLQADLQLIGKAAKSNTHLLTGDLKEKHDSARMNLMLLRRDGSQGAHNFEYAVEIMNQATRDLDAVKAAIK